MRTTQEKAIADVVRAVMLLTLVIASNAEYLAWLERTGWQEAEWN